MCGVWCAFHSGSTIAAPQPPRYRLQYQLCTAGRRASRDRLGPDPLLGTEAREAELGKQSCSARLGNGERRIPSLLQASAPRLDGTIGVRARFQGCLPSLGPDSRGSGLSTTRFDGSNSTGRMMANVPLTEAASMVGPYGVAVIRTQDAWFTANKVSR